MVGDRLSLHGIGFGLLGVAGRGYKYYILYLYKYFISTIYKHYSTYSLWLQGCPRTVVLGNETYVQETCSQLLHEPPCHVWGVTLHYIIVRYS